MFVLRRLLIAALGLVFWGWAVASEFQPNITYLNFESFFDVHADASSVLERKLSFRVNTERGVKTNSQLPLSYSTSLQELEVIEAYTTTKSGVRIDVTPDKILVQQSPQSRSAPMFDDAKVKTVVFPGVDVGSVLTLHFKRFNKKPIFPEQFSLIQSFSIHEDYRSVRMTVRAPESLPLFVDAIDIPGGRIASNTPGTQLWQWSLENRAARAPEIGSVSSLDLSPRVVVTTFPSYEAVAQAYLARAAEKSRVTSGIQALADQITAGLADRRAQAEALYHWVSTNIRYVAIFLNFGGVVPHDAQSIADAKYGDCKDHVTLLQALLTAKGIRSSPVLVNASTTYWVSEAAAPDAFNHVISYLPDLKLFVDSTIGYAPFGTLSLLEQGKKALVTDDGSGRPRLVALPTYTPERDRFDIRTQLVIDEEGNLSGQSTVTNQGAYDLIFRSVFANVTPGTEQQVAAELLRRSGQSGSGTYEHRGLRDLGSPFVYSTQFKLDGYAQFPGPGAFVVPKGLVLNNIADYLEPFTTEKREFPFPLGSRRVDESISITLPKGVSVQSLPKPVDIVSPFGVYHANYAQTGSVITLKRRLDVALKAPYFQPKDYPSAKAFAQQVSRSLNAPIPY